MLTRPFAAAALAATLLAPPTRAQAPAIPLELARALLALPSATPEIVVGRAPEGFPAELVPAGGRVLGGVRRDSSSMLLAAAMPQAPEAAAEALQQALLAAGWAFPGMQETRGFVGSNATRWHSLCRGDNAVMLSSAPAAGGGSYLRVDYTTQRSQFQCNPARGGTRGGMPWADVPLPVLNVPPGAVVVSTSMGGGMVGNGGAGATASVRLRTGIGTVELMSRFAAQLAQAGWAPSQPLGSAGMGMQTFRLRAADGKEWFGALTAVAIPGSDVHDLGFAVSPLPPPE